jgi:alkylhydroperoxidase family enzyme
MEALEEAIFSSPLLPRQLMREIFVVASIAARSDFCQAHGALTAAEEGGSLERIRALWDFERSPLFNDAERIALRIARDSAGMPHSLTGAHALEWRKHWDANQRAHMIAVICLAAWRNRRDVLQFPLLDEETLAWANEHLAPVGWRSKSGSRSMKRRGPQPPWRKI